MKNQKNPLKKYVDEIDTLDSLLNKSGKLNIKQQNLSIFEIKASLKKLVIQLKNKK